MPRKSNQPNKPNASSASGASLVIGKKSQQPLNKQQQTFNRLVKKLERLRRELDSTTQRLNQQLDFYSKQIYPLEQELVAHRIAGVKIFYRFYQDQKAVWRKDRKTLRKLIIGQLNSILHLSADEPDAEIKEIFAAMEGVSFEEATAPNVDALKDDMRQTFEEFGVDINLDDFHAGLSEEDMMRKMFEIMEETKSQVEAREASRPVRKKSKKQLAKEERERQIEEARNKSVASIYKQLARALHPDLEQDPIRKAEKETLMKDLTTAYEKDDLHTLLRLELAWIHREESNLDQLSDDKLSIYNEMLKQQCREVETETFMLGQHPRYQPLERFSTFGGFGGYRLLNLEHEKRELQALIADAQESVERLRGDQALQELRDLIAVCKQPVKRMKFNDMDDLAEFLRQQGF